MTPSEIFVRLLVRAAQIAVLEAEIGLLDQEIARNKQAGEIIARMQSRLKSR